MDEKRRVSLTEVLSDIQRGLSDSELMGKHGLSRNQLEKVFEKLVESGRMSQAEVDARKALVEDVLEFDADSGQRPSTQPGRPADLGRSDREPFSRAPGSRGMLPPQPPNWQKKAAFGIIAGLVTGTAGSFLPPFGRPQTGAPEILSILGLVMALAGVGMQVWGCYYLAKGKGYHGPLRLAGAFCGLGLVLLLLLPNKYEKPGTSETALVVIVVVLALSAVVLFLALPNYESSKPGGAGTNQKACDRAASRDVAKLAAAFERLGNEIVDLGGDYNDAAVSRLADGNVLQYLVGPYYGWAGSTKKCEVLIRMNRYKDRWIVEGTSLRGSHPAGTTSRYVYSATVGTGEDLPAERRNDISDSRNGKSSDWNSYPYTASGQGEMCYTESIIQVEGPPGSRKFTLRTPKGVPCHTILPQ